MKGQILQADVENRRIRLDPRTKLLLLITMTVFVLGGAASGKLAFLMVIFCILPLVLLLTSKKYKAAIYYGLIYSGMTLLYQLGENQVHGIFYFLLLGTAGIVTRFMPGVIMGIYVVSTTTVSEFTAAMLRMHISENLIIPLSVMFRFFPTVTDEFSSINAAMKMREIRFGGKNATKMLEYRFIPLLCCSVKIGDELSAAALTRGLGGKVKRTNICDIGFHMQDLISIVICVIPYIFWILSKLGIM